MPDLTAISAVLASLSHLRALTSTAIELRDESKLLLVTNQLQGQISDLLAETIQVQQAQAALVAENQRLKDQVRQLQDWATEKTRYALNARPQGTLVYTLKPAFHTDEPVHHLCPNCYESGKKSILQLHWPGGTLRCPACKTELA